MRTTTIYWVLTIGLAWELGFGGVSDLLRLDYVRTTVEHVPSWQVEGLIEDYAHYARGEAAALSHHVREVTGIEPRDLRTFARDYARAFVGV